MPPTHNSTKIITIVMYVILFTSIGIVLSYSIIPLSEDYYSEFYILSDSGSSQDYRRLLENGTKKSLIVGIVNHEHRAINYTIQVRLNGTLLNVTNILLDHNESWENHVYFTPFTTDTLVKLEILLFIDGDISPYLELHIWVEVVEKIGTIPLPPLY